jgi:ribosomal protein S27E
VAAAVVLPATSDSQVSAKSGVFLHVKSNSAGAPKLTVLESVRCLECGAVYAKPTGGGTVQANPGCPDCGYVGWVGTRVRAYEELWTPRHSDAGHQPPPYC